jgi:hypothetical protein
MVPINSEAEFAVAGTALDFRQLIRISSNESRMCPPCDVKLDGIHKFEDCCNDGVSMAQIARQLNVRVGTVARVLRSRLRSDAAKFG